MSCKLSIIIPVYNAQDYLNNCLDSILKQTISDYEIILVNDGSTDFSQKIIDNYSQCFPQIIKSICIANGGQGRARNIALDISSGEYIGFVDSDDYIDPNMFPTLIDLIESQNADIAVCNWYRFEGENFTYENYKSASNVLTTAGAVWNKLFKKSLIGNLKFPEGLWYEDFAFSANLLISSKKTVFTEKPLYFYRADNISTMRNRNALKNLDIIEIMEVIKQSTKKITTDDFEFLLINNVLLDSVNRVALLNSKDKQYVIIQLLNYVHQYIPDLNDCDSYKAEILKRRIIMKLNYYRLYEVSKLILKIKSAV